MKTFNSILIITLLNIGLLFSQNNESYSVYARILESNEYNKSRILECPYIKLDFTETIKALGDSMIVYEMQEAGKTYKCIEHVIYRNGKVEEFDAYETGVVAYYPELNTIVYGNCDMNYVVDMNTGKWISPHGDPQYDCISPSNKYRIAYLDGDIG